MTKDLRPQQYAVSLHPQMTTENTCYLCSLLVIGQRQVLDTPYSLIDKITVTGLTVV